jgi:hypothetical protein
MQGAASAVLTGLPSNIFNTLSGLHIFCQTCATKSAAFATVASASAAVNSPAPESK